MRSETLVELLERTRHALLEGDFAALDDLARETDASIGALDDADPELLELVREMAGANIPLFEAAARGVAAAKRRLSEPAAFVTYDSRGQRGTVEPEEPGRSRRF